MPASPAEQSRPEALNDGAARRRQLETQRLSALAASTSQRISLPADRSESLPVGDDGSARGRRSQLENQRLQTVRAQSSETQTAATNGNAEAAAQPTSKSGGGQATINKAVKAMTKRYMIYAGIVGWYFLDITGTIHLMIHKFLTDRHVIDAAAAFQNSPSTGAAISMAGGPSIPEGLQKILKKADLLLRVEWLLASLLLSLQLFVYLIILAISTITIACSNPLTATVCAYAAIKIAF
ncbi:MAG: hypothetical protein WCT10_05385 [Patescibacteria group bacterium]|jgi:hypothetical protein